MRLFNRKPKQAPRPTVAPIVSPITREELLKDREIYATLMEDSPEKGERPHAFIEQAAWVNEMMIMTTPSK